MLIHLKLKNIALIEIIEINFEKGLNIFTGDSGSGKSLILDSLNVLFGGNNIPSKHLIRPGVENCLIQAKFLSSYKVKDWLIKNGFQKNCSEIIIARKSSKKNNKILSKFTLNDLPINKKKLETLGMLLIDFAGQSDSLVFNSEETRKQIIDDLGSKKINDINSKVKICWEELTVLRKNLAQEMKLSKEKAENNFVTKEMLEILEGANLNSNDEIENLKLSESKLSNASNIRNSLKSTINNLICGGIEDLSVASLITNSIKQLNRIEEFDLEIQKFKNTLINIQNDLENFIFSLTSYLEQVENDDESLEDIQSRIFFLRNLERTFSLELPQLIKKRDELRSYIETNSNEQKLNQLENQINQLTVNLNNLYDLQTIQRKKIANDLQDSVTSVLGQLGLENARFFVEFQNAQPSSSGTNHINFLFSANPDQSLAPLSKVISGGEMSRFLLAIKSSISRDSSSFFLDEIDSGLSGKSLYSLVKLIKEISKERQVICITHQPYLAAAAKAHFKVKKNVIEGLTFTSIKKLTTKIERQNELTELIGGGFEEANDYASILIEKAAA